MRVSYSFWPQTSFRFVVHFIVGVPRFEKKVVEQAFIAIFAEFVEGKVQFAFRQCLFGEGVFDRGCGIFVRAVKGVKERLFGLVSTDLPE